MEPQLLLFGSFALAWMRLRHPPLTAAVGTHHTIGDQTLSAAGKWHLKGEILALFHIRLEIFCLKESVFHFRTSPGLCVRATINVAPCASTSWSTATASVLYCR